MKTKWLDRRIARPGPHLTLCLSEAEFDAVLAKLKIRERPPFVIYGSDATTHHLDSDDGYGVVVCLTNFDKLNAIETAGVLIHEAVHVWQEYCLRIGEKNPGLEQEAYAIQAIAQELMSEFARRLSEVKQT